MQTRLSVALLLVLINLVACSTSKEELLPQDVPSMHEIYEHQFGHSSVDAARQAAQPSQPAVARIEGLRNYTRTAENEIENLFPRLPNPTLVMFVYPHLSSGHPIPGYTTAFPMYESVQYAQPGETRLGGRGPF